MYRAKFNESNFEAAFQELSLKSRHRYYSAIDRIIEKYESIGDDEDDDIIDLENMVFIQDKGILRNLKIDKSGIFTKAYEYQSRTEILKIKEITSSFNRKERKISSNKITLKKQKGNKRKESFVDTEINRKLCNNFKNGQLSKKELFENKIHDYLEVKKADLKIKESDSQDLKFSKIVCDELLTNILNKKNENIQKNKVLQNYNNTYFLRKYGPVIKSSKTQDSHFTNQNSNINKNISSTDQITRSYAKRILPKRKELNNVNTDFLSGLSNDTGQKFNKNINLKDVRIIVDKLDCCDLTSDQYFINNTVETDILYNKNENHRKNNVKSPLQIIKSKENNDDNFANTCKSLHPAKRIKLDICENNKTNTICKVNNLSKQKVLLNNTVKNILDRKSECRDKNKTSIKLQEENTTLLNNKPTTCFLSQLFGDSSITNNVEKKNNFSKNNPHIIWIKNNNSHTKNSTKNVNHVFSQTSLSSTKEAFLNISSSSNKQNYRNNQVFDKRVKTVQQFKEISNIIEKNDSYVQSQKHLTRQLNESQILDRNFSRNSEIQKDLSKENLSVDSDAFKINKTIQKSRKSYSRKSINNSVTETNIECNFQNIQTHIGKKKISKQRLNKTMPTINQNGNKNFSQENFSLSLNRNESLFTNNNTKRIFTKQLKNVTVLSKKQSVHCYNTRSKCSKSISNDHLNHSSVLIKKCCLLNCTI